MIKRRFFALFNDASPKTPRQARDKLFGYVRRPRFVDKTHGVLRSGWRFSSRKYGGFVAKAYKSELEIVRARYGRHRDANSRVKHACRTYKTRKYFRNSRFFRYRPRDYIYIYIYTLYPYLVRIISKRRRLSFQTDLYYRYDN